MKKGSRVAGKRRLLPQKKAGLPQKNIANGDGQLPTPLPAQPHPGQYDDEPTNDILSEVTEILRRVQYLQRLQDRLSREPRLDTHLKPSEETYGKIHEACVIQVTDYSSEDMDNGEKMSNAEFVAWAATSRRPKEMKVRWINVAGISWDVVSALASKYSMQRLAIKDLLEQRAQARSKSEYYREHLYLRVLTHVLGDTTHADDINVRLALLDIFLYPDGTLITFYPDGDLGFTAPIVELVIQDDSLLRETADVSLLLHSLLDLVVKRTLQVTDDYRQRIESLKQRVLQAPDILTVRALYILSSNITLHKTTMAPIKTLLYGLCEHDARRSKAVMGSLPGTIPAIDEFPDRMTQGPSSQTSPFEAYISEEARVYLTDLQDHIDYALTNLDVYAADVQNLIDYSFNGMNFESMWSVQHGHSDLLFWKIALPVLGVCVPLFLWKDIVRIARYLKQRRIVHRMKNIDITVDDAYELRKLA
ncbi:hypothetical protein PENSPDRAFT_692194 [Peniophora sp. CONT]|nr:hypothetical protein PENSPDRAFT_692194 [Peniophora sp. CONT]